MLNDISNLLLFFVRFFVIGGALVAALLWLVITLGDTPLFPLLVGAIPAVLVIAAFAKQPPKH